MVVERDGKFFFRRKDTKVMTFPIGSLFSTKPQKGDIGIEIEVEGNKFPKDGNAPGGSISASLIPKAWVYHHDGSLRGHDNAEYVLRSPVKFKEVDKHLDDLWDMFTKYGSKLDDSNRTSVHVHLNVQQWHLSRLASFMSLYISVEEILTQWCGDHRVGNLFCLRAKDAPGIVKTFQYFVENNGNGKITSNFHYGGINIHSLAKFGSIEIRSLRGVTDVNIIKMWVAILQRLYEMSDSFKDPRESVEDFSGLGPLGFFQKLLGPYADQVIRESHYTIPQIETSMWEGVRIAQDFCYCREWKELDEKTVRPDPFKRKAKEVYESLAANGASPINSAAEINLIQSSQVPAYTLYTPNNTTFPPIDWSNVGINPAADLLSAHPVPPAPEPEQDEPEGWWEDEVFDGDDEEEDIDF